MKEGGRIISRNGKMKLLKLVEKCAK